MSEQNISYLTFRLLAVGMLKYIQVLHGSLFCSIACTKSMDKLGKNIGQNCISCFLPQNLKDHRMFLFVYSKILKILILKMLCNI